MKSVRSISVNWCLFFIIWVLGIGSGQAASRDEIIFFFNDAAGSAVTAVNEAGEVCWSEVYTPYGDKTVNDDLVSPTGCGIVGEERGFTGHTEDVNSDLVYMQQRYYDPSIGRFLSIDPMDADPANPKTINRYAYANNNPYKYVDPDGRLGLLINSFRRDLSPQDALQISAMSQASLKTGLGAAAMAASVATPGPEDALIAAAGIFRGLRALEASYVPKSGRVDVPHLSQKAARRAAERQAGMGKHGGKEQLPDQPLRPGSRSPQGDPGVRTEVRSTDTGRIVHHDPYGHKKDNVPSHYGVDTPGGTTHHTYPSPHNPQHNR